MTMHGEPASPEVNAGGSDLRTFHLLVANTLIAGTANNFLWFALIFWMYLETRSVIATSVIGGLYMLLFAASGIFFGTYVDGHRRRTSMLVSSVASLTFFLLATVVYFAAPVGSLPSLSASSSSVSRAKQPREARIARAPVKAATDQTSRCHVRESSGTTTSPIADAPR